MTTAEVELPRSLVEQARAVNIVDLIGRSVKLVRRGGAHWGLCPFHAEKSGSFKVENARRAYHCFGCGAHGGTIDWVMNTSKIDFRQAVMQLTGGTVATPAFERPAYAPKPVEEDDGFKYALQVWENAQPARGTHAEAYLRARGIRRPVSAQIRFAPRLIHAPTKFYFPALIARLSDDTGFLAIQRTYLDPKEPRKANVNPNKMTKAAMHGGAIRLSDPCNGVLGLAEGLENALSASQLYSVPTWATCGSNRLSKLELPKDVTLLMVFGDPKPQEKDQAFAAQDFYERERGLQVEVIFPAAHFACDALDDFNDVLKKGAPRAR